MTAGRIHQLNSESEVRPPQPPEVPNRSWGWDKNHQTTAPNHHGFSFKADIRNLSEDLGHPVLTPLVLSPHIGEHACICMSDYVSISGKNSLVFQWLHICATMHSHSWTANVVHATATMACCKGKQPVHLYQRSLFKGLNQNYVIP